MIAASDRIDLASGVSVVRRLTTDDEKQHCRETPHHPDHHEVGCPATTSSGLTSRGTPRAPTHLADVVRGCSWPLNTSGVFILDRVGRRLDAVVPEFAEAFDLPLDVARFDALQFVWTLNALALVNVTQSGSRFRQVADWLGLALRLAPAGALPAPITRRRPLDTGSALRGAASSLRACMSRVIAISAVSTVALLPLAAIVGTPGRLGPLAVTLGVATGMGVGLHEAGHVASLRGVPSALVARGRRTFVLHAPLGPVRRAFVAVAGPAVAVAAGLALVWVGGMESEPSLVISGLPLTAHALSLTMIGGDGRAACGV